MLYHGEHGRLQGTQGTHKYILAILCLVLGHVISWRTWTPTRNSRHTQVYINYLMFSARPCYHGEHGRLQGTQGTQKYICYEWACVGIRCLFITCITNGHHLVGFRKVVMYFESQCRLVAIYRIALTDNVG